MSKDLKVKIVMSLLSSGVKGVGSTVILGINIKYDSEQFHWSRQEDGREFP